MPSLAVPSALRALIYGGLSILLIAGVWSAAQYVLAWWYDEDLADQTIPPRS